MFVVELTAKPQGGVSQSQHHRSQCLCLGRPTLERFSSIAELVYIKLGESSTTTFLQVAGYNLKQTQLQQMN